MIWDHEKWVAVPAFGLETIEALVRGRFAGIHREDAHGPLDLDTPPSPMALEAFTPCVVVPPAAAERFVVHPKFGEGRVLRAFEGKLDIDFGEQGIKTLLERFVGDR